MVFASSAHNQAAVAYAWRWCTGHQQCRSALPYSPLPRNSCRYDDYI